MRLALTIIVALSAGCASGWTKPGGTRAAFEEDSTLCGGAGFRAFVQRPDSFPLAERNWHSSRYASCMELRGWRRARRSGSGSSTR